MGNGRDGLPPVPSIPLTAEDLEQVVGETSIGGLVRDATAHLSTLVRAEVELARSEVAAEIKKGVRGSVYFIVALTVLLFSLFFFFLALGFLGSDLGLPLSASFAIVFVLMLLITAAFGFLGYKKVRKLKAPEKTISSARDTVATLRHRDGR